jgi:hypothetical protein
MPYIKKYGHNYENGAVGGMKEIKSGLIKEIHNIKR